MSLSALNRRKIYQEFRKEEYDLLIIGGGITGAGIALDATKRGMKVALVEMQDFASGTSSRSTKLVHGGLRYLKNLQVDVVRTTGQERAIVYENGPHVTTPEKMLLPFHKGGTFGRFSTSIGLALYDRLAKVKRDERRVMLSREEVLSKVPTIKDEGLKGGGYYVEYRTDDARLTIEVLKRAVELGATALNYIKAIDFNYDEEGKIEAVVLKDQLTNNTYLATAKVIINATGPWVEGIRSKAAIEGEMNKHLLLTKGVHLVFAKADFPLEQAVYFDTEHDKRMIFAIPRGNKVYVGTTDTRYEGSREKPQVSSADRHYLLQAINYMFPKLKLGYEAIESSWAGIRPLILEEGKDPSEISRKDEIWEDRSGLLTIAGGKLTGYRHMAEEIVDRVADKLIKEHGLKFQACTTRHEPISGGDVGGADQFEHFIAEAIERGVGQNLKREEAEFLARFYGSNVDTLYAIAKRANPDLMEGLPLTLYLQLKYGLLHEGVVTPKDFFVRRTGLLFFDIRTVEEFRLPVVKYMARYFGWSSEQIQHYNSELERAIYEAKNPIEEEGTIKLEQQEEEQAEEERKEKSE